MSTKTTILTQDNKHFLLSEGTTKIVKALQKAGDTGLTYAELQSKTKTPPSTIYVFAQRLRDAKLVSSKKNADATVRLILRNAATISLGNATRL